MKVPLSSEKVYISLILDLADRALIALEISDRNDTILTDAVLEKAHKAYPEAKRII